MCRAAPIEEVGAVTAQTVDLDVDGHLVDLRPPDRPPAQLFVDNGQDLYDPNSPSVLDLGPSSPSLSCKPPDALLGRRATPENPILMVTGELVMDACGLYSNGGLDVGGGVVGTDSSMLFYGKVTVSGRLSLIDGDDSDAFGVMTDNTLALLGG